MGRICLQQRRSSTSIDDDRNKIQCHSYRATYSKSDNERCRATGGPAVYDLLQLMYIMLHVKMLVLSAAVKVKKQSRCSSGTQLQNRQQGSRVMHTAKGL